MGGDHGPDVVVAACARALRADPALKILLVGQPEALERPLRRAGLHQDLRCTLLPATEVVGMDEEPAKALRGKKDSSMRVALTATARFVLKMIPGIDRPAIMAAVPAERGQTQVLDLGANAECSPEQLLHFGQMGCAACRVLTGKARPTVGLLNIGSESIKGNTVVKQAADLFAASSLNFQGFVEGNDIYAGTVDVVVCDGFSGNVVLKASEGLARMLMADLKGAFQRGIYPRLAALLAAPVLMGLKRHLDPGRYNGASLVGLRGVVVKSHGSADAAAFANAIRIAALESADNLPQRIAEDLQQG